MVSGQFFEHHVKFAQYFEKHCQRGVGLPGRFSLPLERAPCLITYYWNATNLAHARLLQHDQPITFASRCIKSGDVAQLIMLDKTKYAKPCLNLLVCGRETLHEVVSDADYMLLCQIGCAVIAFIVWLSGFAPALKSHPHFSAKIEQDLRLVILHHCAKVARAL